MKVRTAYDATSDTPQTFAELLDAKRKVLKEFTAGCTAFAEGPKPNVDYKALVAREPKMTAEIEYIDKTMFEGSQLVFGTLLDSRASSKNHADHLVITRQQRDELVRHIDSAFGEKLKASNPSWNVSQAILIRAKLLEFKTADEPWD